MLSFRSERKKTRNPKLETRNKLESRKQMTTLYNRLVDSTIRHLEELKARGVRFVSVSPEVLARLSSPQPRTSPPRSRVQSAVHESPVPPITDHASRITHQPSQAKLAAFADLRQRALA